MRRYTFYMIFAVIAITLNVTVQFLAEIILKAIFPELAWTIIEILAQPFEMWFFICLGLGTLVGFVFKFLVDKFIVFEEKELIINQTARQATKYLFFAIFTTIIFWGTETLFQILWNAYALGAIIGLAIGYTIKFVLDSKFVFIDQQEKE
ncbi:MAG: GtrA family protein [Candidatus Hodarchaeota archaeon]